MHGKGKALTVLAHKLARAVYYIWKRDQVFDQEKLSALSEARRLSVRVYRKGLYPECSRGGALSVRCMDEGDASMVSAGA